MQPRARVSTSHPLVCTCCAQTDANVADSMLDVDEAPPRAHTGPPRGMIDVPASRYEAALHAADHPAPGTDAFQTAVRQVDAPRTPQGKQPVRESPSDDSWMHLQQEGNARVRARRGREEEILRTGLQGHVPWPPVKKPAPAPKSEPAPTPVPVQEVPAPKPEPKPAPTPVQEPKPEPVEAPAPVRRSGRIRERATRRG